MMRILKEVGGSAGTRFAADVGYFRIEFASNSIWYFFEGAIIQNGALTLDEVCKMNGVTLVYQEETQNAY
jgi:hypothetical protein